MKARSGSGEIGAFASQALRVNHAGENGAVHIYAGQMIAARFTARGLLEELAEFESHEERHRQIFRAELQRRCLPRCRSYWLCGVGGYGLGLVTGLLGCNAIAATTIAVERVVVSHLEQQVALLRGKDSAAVTAIESILAEERQHCDQSASRLRGRFWSKVLMPVVAATIPFLRPMARRRLASEANEN